MDYLLGEYGNVVIAVICILNAFILLGVCMDTCVDAVSTCMNAVFYR